MKAKRIVISLSIAVTVILALVAGVLIFNKGGKTEPQIFAQPHNQGLISEEFKPITYYFDEGEVRMAKGSDRLVYSYDVNQTATAPVAYEYVFKNASSTEMAVNIKEIDVSGAVVSYQWSDTELDEITQSESHFITQPISTNGTKYLYVVLSPESEDESVVVNTEVKWNYGEAGTLTKIHTVSGLPFTQTYIKNIPINEEDMLLPNMEEGYAFGGWYWDADYLQPVQFPLEYTGKQMYARVGSPLPDDWFGTSKNSFTDPYYQKYGVITTGTPIWFLKSRDVIIPEEHNGKKVEVINVQLTDAINAKIPSTAQYVFYAFSGNKDIRKMFIPKSVKMLNQTFANCTNFDEVVFEQGSQLTEIRGETFENTAISTITIPATVTRFSNNDNGNVFAGCTNLRSVIFEEGSQITDFGSGCFSGCSQLVDINIPSSVRYLGGFSNCTSLTKIDIPEGVTSIGSFSGCTNLSNITIPASVTNIGQNAFKDCTKLSCIAIPSGVTSIGSYAFYNCDGLRTVSIPASVTSMGSYAFYSCDNLLEVTFEQGSQLTAIANNAFYYCKILKGIAIPENVTSIGDYAFQGCKQLESLKFEGNALKTIGKQAFSDSSSSYGYCAITGTVTIPASVETIGEHAFYKNKIQNLVFQPNSNLKTINKCAFGYNSIKQLFIPASVTSIGESAFLDCKSLTDITFESGSMLSSLGYQAFSRCEKLISVNLEACTQLPAIGNAAFRQCCKLESVTIPSSVTKIGQYSFAECAIESITIPSNVTTIVNYAFNKCTGLKEVHLSEGLLTIEDYVFTDCTALEEIEIPASVTSIGAGAFQCYETNRLMTIVVNANNTVYDSRDNCNAIIETATNTLIIGCNGTVIPNGVAAIGDYAFYQRHNLTEITIPSSVITIGQSAFWNCEGLTTLTFEEGSQLTTIGASAFQYCSLSGHLTIPALVETIGVDAFASTDITSLTFEEGSKLTSIGARVFQYCRQLISVAIPEGVTTIGQGAFSTCESLTSVVIPEGVNTIEGSAFSNCKVLPFIIIPSTVTSIGSNAFYNCYKLATVYNLSNLEITKGSTANGYAGYYATNIYTSLDDMPDDEMPEDMRGIIYTEVDGGLAVTGYAGTPTDVVLDSRTIRIDSKAFYNCDTLRSIRIPASVQTIGSEAFYDCDKLLSVTIPASVTNIYSSAFRHCSNLTNVIFEEGSELTRIESNAFANCVKLVYINLENCTLLSVIGSEAFEYCDALAVIVLPENLSSIGVDAFYSCNKLYTVYDLSTKLNITKGSSGNGYVGRYAKEVLYNYDSQNQIIELCGVKYFRYTNETTILQVVDKNIVNLEILHGVTVIPNTMFQDCANLTSVTIPASVTTIEFSSFRNCINLSSVIFEEGSQLITIGSGAFEGCSSLGSIDLPDSVEIIDYDAFYETSLKSIKLPKNLKQIGLKGSGNIASGATFGTKLQGKIVIPASVVSIGYRSFYNCNGITEIEFEKGSQLTQIYGYAFYGCDALTGVTIPASLTTMREYAFNSCDNLSSVIFEAGSNLTSIDSYVFAGASITSLVLPNGLQSIGKYAFSSAVDKGKIIIPSSVTTIGEYAFNECREVTELWFEAGSNLKTISQYAFQNCVGLTSINLPDSVTTIGNNAFKGCTGLQTLTINPTSQLVNIQERAFADCPISGEIYIPASVTSIGNYAFSSCVINNLTFAPNSSLKTIGDAAFTNAKIIKLTIPASVETIGSNAFCGCANLKFLTFESNSKLITISSGAFGSSSSSHSNIQGKLSIPASVQTIGYSAFVHCTGITEVAFEQGSQLTTIGESAFYQCTGLKSITIPASVTSIGNNTFGGCKALASMVVESGNTIYDSRDNCNAIIETATDKLIQGCKTTVIPSNITVIGDYAFYQCYGLTGELIIPATVTSIGNSAFYGCSGLISLTFEQGSQLTSMGTYVFYQCLGLTSLIFDLDTPLASIGNYTFYDCRNISNELIIPNAVTTIGERAFSSCSNIPAITFTQNSKLTTIMQYGFYYCSSAKSVVIPSGVTSIGSYALYGCSKMYTLYNLSSLEITMGSTANGYAGYYAKQICTSLPIESNGVRYVEIDGEFIATEYIGNSSSVVLDSRTTKIGERLFSDNKVIRSIVIPSNVTSIGAYAFYNSNLQSITFEPNSQLTTIGTYAFSGCKRLFSIEIPASVTDMGTYAFRECSVLNSVTFEEGSQLTSISANTFSSCFSLRSIVIPASVTSIDQYAFSSCGKLTNVMFEEGSQLTNIATYAFSYCSGLRSMTIPSGVTSIGSNAFSNCSSLYILYNLSSLSMSTWSSGSDNNGNITKYAKMIYKVAPIQIKGVQYIEENGGLTATCYVGSDANVDLDIRTTKIGDYAFYKNIDITSVTIPANVTSIGTHAFYDCSSLSLVTFEVTEGWKAGSVVLASSDLSNKSTAAYYLKSTYYTRTWTRS